METTSMGLYRVIGSPSCRMMSGNCLMDWVVLLPSFPRSIRNAALVDQKSGNRTWFVLKNMVPFLGIDYITAPNIQGYQNGTLILETTLSPKPYPTHYSSVHCLFPHSCIFGNYPHSSWFSCQRQASNPVGRADAIVAQMTKASWKCKVVILPLILNLPTPPYLKYSQDIQIYHNGSI